MALTAANYAANIKTAARNAAAVAGVTGIAPGDWTIDQRQKYNREMVRQILAYPGSFAPEQVDLALATNTDYGLRGHQFDNQFETGLGAALSGAKAYLDGLYKFLTIAAVILFLALALKHLPARRD